MNLDRLMERALELIGRSSDIVYGDIRILGAAKREGLAVKNGIVEAASRSETSGFGIRVLSSKGAWGFASSAGLEKSDVALYDELHRAFRKAVALATAGGRGRTCPLALAPREAAPGNYVHFYESPYRENPFMVPVEEKLALLLKWDAAMNESSGKLTVRKSAMSFWMNAEVFAAFERGIGTFEARQEFWGGNILVSATASDGAEVQTMTPWGFDGRHFIGGYEIVRGLTALTTRRVDVLSAARAAAEDAEALLLADECPEGEMDVIIMPDHLGLHVHETCHGFEGDRLLGYEETYIGGTFLSRHFAEIGSYRFGSEHVSIVSDATMPGGYGTFAFDDEGTPGQKVYLVEDGIYRNMMTSRETVPQLNAMLGRRYFKGSNGTARASSFNRVPLIRMTNASLLPGSYSLEELIDRVKRGILLTNTVSWSMSEDRKNFDFSLSKGVEIVDGKLGRLLKHPGYTGDNSKFWHSCAGVADARHSRVINFPNCGKGLPGQAMSTGHGSSPALFTGVRVYNRKGHSALSLLSKGR
ncbi:MAG: TldD/PmbA family protein [bacterium]|nr:TldD/PmbA family protein [bacterium]